MGGCARCEVFGRVDTSLEAVHELAFGNWRTLGSVQNCVYGVLKLRLLVPNSYAVWSGWQLTNSATSLEDPVHPLENARISEFINIPFSDSLWTLLLSFSRSTDILIVLYRSIDLSFESSRRLKVNVDFCCYGDDPSATSVASPKASNSF